MSINASFIGNLGRAAETKNVQQWDVTVFSVGVSERNKETTWVECALFGDRGTKIAPHLQTGTKVFVTGTLRQETFERRNGEPGAQLKLRVNDIEFAAPAKQASKPVAPMPQKAVEAPAPAAVNLEDIPF